MERPQRSMAKYVILGLTLVWILLPLQAHAQRVVVAYGVDVQSLDPLVFNNPVGISVGGNLFEGLLGRDRDLKIVSHLSTGHKILSPTKWRFTLRKGVTFHNGEAFNAESVKYSFESHYLPGNKSWKKAYYNTIDRVEVVDEYTVDIITKKPDPILPSRLTLLCIVPPKHIKAVGGEKFAQNPIGTGPFKFVKWIRDNQIVFERNPNYWAGPVPIKDLIFRIMPETQTRVAALQTGEVDIAVNIPPDIAEQLKGKPDYSFKSILGPRILYLYMCQNKQSPLLNEKVRKAINYAVNRESIIKHILMGNAEMLGTSVPIVIFGHDPKLKPYPYDPKKAKQLLAEAGYPNGFEIAMHGPSGRYIRDKEVCQAIAGQLGEVGIKVNLQLLEFNLFMDKIYAKTTHPLYLIGWGHPAFDPDFYLWLAFHTGEPYAQVSDKDLDRILENARAEMDVSKREKLYHDAQKLMYDRSYQAMLYEQKDLYGVSKRTDWTPRGDEMIYLKEVKLK